MKRYHDETLFRRYAGNPILSPEDWPNPINTVFNPAAALVKGRTLLLARVEDRFGLSYLATAWSRDGLKNWTIDKTPALFPEPKTHPEEVLGVEDPRITRLEELNTWAITYTAYSKDGPMVSLATSEDFKKFKRLGPVLRPPDKDAALFPRRINGRWAMIHRPVISPIQMYMWLSFSPDLKHWGDSRVLMRTRDGNAWDGAKLGLCPQPLETPEGWLILYHGVRMTCYGQIYRIGLALLDLEEPWKVLRRSKDWVLTPVAPYELSGDIGNVIFPCGWIHDKAKDELRIYYGAADTCVAVASASMKDVMAYIKACPGPDRELR
ncbi:MAG TPA: glycosidase [Elusimicrobia bacterium]|nr:glycosidase [Elusimicrobiota bacterium]